MKVSWLLLVPALLAIGCGGETADEPTTESESAPAAAEASSTETVPAKKEVSLEVADWDGIQAAIASEKGKVVVVDYWSTGCEPCMRELPNLVKIHKDFAGDQLSCFTVNIDFYESEGAPSEDLQSDVLEILKGIDADCRNILSSTADEKVYDNLEIDAIPLIRVYSPDGKLAKQFLDDPELYGEEGISYEKHVRPFVESLLNGDKSE